MRRHTRSILLLSQIAIVAGFAVLVRAGRMPLGVRPEWEWLRIKANSDALSILLALIAILLYGLYAASGLASLRRGKRSATWLVGLIPMSLMVQVCIQEGAPQGYGLAKWAIALHSPGSSGYYTVAKEKMINLGSFLAGYADWTKSQDYLHIGTHPPGLFVVSWASLRLMEANPGLARSIVTRFPMTLDIAFQSVSPIKPLPIADRASLALVGFVTLLSCALTTIPLYWLARARLSVSASWVAAALWPVVPSAMMFQPAADTAFPVLATTALALAAWSGRCRWLALVAGIVLAIGTQFSLAFFPVGLIAAIVYASEPKVDWRRKFLLTSFTGIGFLALTFVLWWTTQANPFTIWLANAANHSRFYVHYPRSYWAWLVENPIELAVAIGLPTTFWIVSGARTGPQEAWTTIGVLILLTVSGKNLSEVARLWLPLMPPLLLMAGAGFDRHFGRPFDLAATIGLVGIQTLVLESTIQVVYPI